MLDLHVIQANWGDCLLLEYRVKEQETSKFILVDGGPTDTYIKHLQYVLKEKVGQGSHLDLVVVSHIDNDHICGIIRFLEYLKLDKEDPEKKVPRIIIDGLWHNTFRQNIAFDSPKAKEVIELATRAENRGHLYSLPMGDEKGFSEGEKISKLADHLGISVNPGFKDKIILAETASIPFEMGQLKIWILGPTRHYFENIQKKWSVWLQKIDKEPTKAARDSSPPNLSSIMLLVKEEGGRKILLPGDGTDKEILAGLKNLGKLAADGSFHVDVLKVPHHGSRRNVSPEFFEKVTADVYVISADDKDKNKNPDLATLKWIVEAANKQHRSIKILATNETESIKKLKKDYGQIAVIGLSGSHYATV